MGERQPVRQTCDETDKTDLEDMNDTLRLYAPWTSFNWLTTQMHLREANTRPGENNNCRQLCMILLSTCHDSHEFLSPVLRYQSTPHLASELVLVICHRPDRVPNRDHTRLACPYLR